MEKEFTTVEKVEYDIQNIEKIVPFYLGDVVLSDGIFKNAMNLDMAYLKSFDTDRLLYYFREVASLPQPEGAEPYGGWERTDARGHTLGHYLSATAMIYASTKDAEIKEKSDRIISVLKECQDAIGTGYVAAFPTSHIDKLDNRKPVWCPWYMFHKVIAGIFDTYVYTGNEDAFTVLLKLTDWVDRRTEHYTYEEMQRILSIEYGAMNELFYNLYKITGDKKHLELGHRFNLDKLITPISENRDILAGLHANKHIPIITGVACGYEVSGDPKFEACARNFWDIVINTRTYAIGGNSNNEHFGPANNMAYNVGNCNCESCNTYNMQKLTRHLFGWTGDTKYASIYQRALFNMVLGGQNPETGMMTYFHPQAAGFFKTYNTPFDSFWCCTGTGMEAYAKLNDSIYFRNKDNSALYVNLFVASELDFKEQGVTVKQTTAFPTEQGTTLTVSASDDGEHSFDLKIFVPDWAKKGANVKINGVEQNITSEANSYITLSRGWKNGDTVGIEMPFSLTASPLVDDNDTMAFMYGPLVLSGLMGTESMTTTTVGVRVTVPLKQPDAEGAVIVIENGSAAEWAENPENSFVKSSEAPNTFTVKSEDKEITFVPYYTVYKERFANYYKVIVKDTDEYTAYINESKRIARLQETVIDTFPVGNDQYEISHNMQMQQSVTGSYNGICYRDASPGGWFSYDMTVRPDEQMYLVIKYWGGDNWRTFKIYADDTIIVEKTMTAELPGQFFDERYELPVSLTQGKDTVTVKFVPNENSRTAGIYGIRIERGHSDDEIG